MTVAVLVAEEHGRSVFALDHEESIVATHPNVTRREPLEPAPDVAGEERLIVRDSQILHTALRAHRQPTKTTGGIRDDRTIAAGWVSDNVAVVGLHAGRSRFRERVSGNAEGLMKADRAAPLTFDSNPAIEIECH